MLEESAIILAQTRTAPSGAAALVLSWFKRKNIHSPNWISTKDKNKPLIIFFVIWFLLDSLKLQGCLLLTCWVFKG